MLRLFSVIYVECKQWQVFQSPLWGEQIKYGFYFLNACAQYILYGSAWLEWITLYKTFFLVSLHSIVLVWFIISAHWNYCWSVCAEVSSRYSLKNINLCCHVLTLHRTGLLTTIFVVKTKQRWETLIYFGSFKNTTRKLVRSFLRHNQW